MCSRGRGQVRIPGSQLRAWRGDPSPASAPLKCPRGGLGPTGLRTGYPTGVGRGTAGCPRGCSSLGRGRRGTTIAGLGLGRAPTVGPAGAPDLGQPQPQGAPARPWTPAAGSQVCAAQVTRDRRCSDLGEGRQRSGAGAWDRAGGAGPMGWGRGCAATGLRRDCPPGGGVGTTAPSARQQPGLGRQACKGTARPAQLRTGAPGPSSGRRCAMCAPPTPRPRGSAPGSREPRGVIAQSRAAGRRLWRPASAAQASRPRRCWVRMVPGVARGGRGPRTAGLGMGWRGAGLRRWWDGEDRSGLRGC